MIQEILLLRWPGNCHSEGTFTNGISLSLLRIHENLFCWSLHHFSFCLSPRQSIFHTRVCEPTRCFLDEWVLELVNLIWVHLKDGGIILKFFFSTRQTKAISRLKIAMQTDQGLLEAIVKLNLEIRQHVTHTKESALELCN
jgi:hypothetical protein